MMRRSTEKPLRAAGLVVLMMVLLPSGLAWAVPESAMPAEARVHNERGVALLVAGEYERGVEELLIAYDRMPDALVYRASRGQVIGSLRSALNQLYASSGEPRHLCRLRDLQERHLEALQAALGASFQPQEVAGSERVLRETQAALAQRAEADPCSEAPPALLAAPVSPAVPRPTAAVKAADVVPPLHLPREPGRGLQIGGGVALGVGVAALGVMTYGLIVAADLRRQIEQRTATVPMRTSMGDLEIERLYRQGSEHRVLAAVAGALGGLSAVTGAILVGRYHRRRALAAATPVFAPGYAGMSAGVRF